MNWRIFLKEHALFFLMQGFYLCFTTTLLNLLRVNAFAILFISFLYIGINFGFPFYDTFRKERYLKQAIYLADQLEETHYLSEILEVPETYCDLQWHTLFKRVGKSMNDKIAQYRQSNEDYRQYIETWVHEVKTPIASGKLIIENHRDEVTQSIEEELDKVDQYVEQALYYARSSTVEKDYVIKRCDLKKLLSEAIKKQAKQFVTHHISVSMQHVEQTVYADSKWMDFVLGQIISNAIKYRKEEGAMLCFSAEKTNQSVILKISDNGIGIIEKDCPRLFDKGFTGENGRKYTKSTGIGLYLVKQLCDKMNVGSSIESTVQVGTTLTLTFPLTDFYQR